ncbi:MAG: NFACT RNA binding domain-containing protein [Bacteroidetes bacterium]|nr:NFACT RNA binding domain-containing protein [Bacteroidota bacterium]
MLNNYYTLLHLASEIRSELTGAKILRALTQRKYTLELLFENPDGRFVRLVASCLPQDNFIFTHELQSPNLKGANVLSEMTDKILRALGVVENERQLFFEFNDDTRLTVNLYGASANAYYFDKDGAIINAFLKPSDYIGKKLGDNLSAPKFPSTSADFQARFVETSGDLARRLSKCIPTIDSILSREIIYRYALANGQPTETNLNHVRIETDGDYAALFEVVTATRKELLQPSPRIYLHDGNPVAFGLIDLKHLQINDFERYDSVNDCVHDFVIHSKKSDKIFIIRKNILGRLEHKKGSLRRTLAKIEADVLNNRAEKYQGIAEYLMSNLAGIKQGMSAVQLPIENSQIEVRLDPALKPVQNAQAYFEKAKHARVSAQQAIKRKIEIEKEIEKIESLAKQVEGSFDLKFLTSLTESKSQEESEQIPFRVFEHNGYKVYVGKDARNNDELTFGFAKPNDVFLHARGVSGSHVIIRNSSREYPQKQVIKFAASIAAHYSKARTSGIVPVAYTMRKFVKKAKGQPGAVFVDREEVIFVKPEIPQN